MKVIIIIITSLIIVSSYYLCREKTITKAYLMEEYAKDHFLQKHGFFSFTKIPIQELLTFSSTPLQYPLCKIHRTFFSEALEFNHFLWDYTDLHRLVKNRFASLRNIIFRILVSPLSLVDEYYCQVMKQMTGCTIAYDLIDTFYLLVYYLLFYYSDDEFK